MATPESIDCGVRVEDCTVTLRITLGDSGNAAVLAAQIVDELQQGHLLLDISIPPVGGHG